MTLLTALWTHIKNGSRLLDVTSMGLSLVCVAHCLLLPFVVAALPIAGDLTHSEWVHQVLVAVAVPLTGWTIYRSGGWRKWPVLLLAVSGLIALTAGAFYPPARENEVLISVVGAIGVAMAHLINFLEHNYAHSRAVAHDCHTHD